MRRDAPRALCWSVPQWSNALTIALSCCSLRVLQLLVDEGLFQPLLTEAVHRLLASRPVHPDAHARCRLLAPARRGRRLCWRGCCFVPWGSSRPRRALVS